VSTVKATLLNQKADAAPLAPEILAFVHIGSTVTDAIFDKIALTTAVHANWHMKFQNAQYPLDSIKLEIGYADSQGIISFRNSGTLMGAPRSAPMIPLIWREANRHQIVQTAFLKGASDDVMVRYKLLFQISPTLPTGFKDQFVATEKLQVTKQAQDFTLKVFLQ
jgi:hypothetical protein